MIWSKASAIALYCVACTVAAVALFTAMTVEGTQDNPSGEAGLYAPLVAFSVAVLFLIEVFDVGVWPSRRLRIAAVSLGSLASAYLWLADEAGVHPSDTKLIIDLSVVWIVAAVAASTLILVIILSNRGDEN